jgi:hypothetical protein
MVIELDWLKEIVNNMSIEYDKLTTPLRKKRMLRITHVEMLPLETKQSGGKLLPHSDLRGGMFLEEVSRSRKRTDGGHLWVR